MFPAQAALHDLLPWILHLLLFQSSCNRKFLSIYSVFIYLWNALSNSSCLQDYFNHVHCSSSAAARSGYHYVVQNTDPLQRKRFKNKRYNQGEKEQFLPLNEYIFSTCRTRIKPQQNLKKTCCFVMVLFSINFHEPTSVLKAGMSHVIGMQRLLILYFPEGKK